MSQIQAVPIREFMKFTPDELLAGLKTNHHVLFEDNKVLSLNYKEIIMNRTLFGILEAFPDLPLISDYSLNNFYTNGVYTGKTINKCFECIATNIVEKYVIPTNNIDIMDDVYKAMYRINNYIYNNIVYGNLEYAMSLNILNFLDIQLNSELISAMRDVNEKMDRESINRTYEVLDKIIRTEPRYRDNPVGRAYISGMVNANQIKQVLASRGYVTEIDSSIFKYPVASSFTLGLYNLYDLAVESRSGAKALYLSNKAVQSSEYFARELQLVTMIAESIVFTDCGSKDYLEWYVRPKEISGKSDIVNLIGKLYLNEETGKEEYITHEHIHLEGKTIKLRSSMNCKLKHKNKICAACYGKLAYNFHRHDNVGHRSSTTMTHKLTQSILSTKHLTASANTGEFKLSDAAKKFFIVKEKDGYAFRANVLGKVRSKLYLIVDQEQAFGLKDIGKSSDVLKLDPSRISRIESVIMVSEDIKSGNMEYTPIVIKDGNKYGAFTYKFLEYIIENGYTLDKQDRYMVDLTNWKYATPIIKLPQVEYSFLALNNEIKSKLKSIKTVKNVKSSETKQSLLQKIFDLANSKLDVNIALIETMLYTFTVSSIENQDFDLARNTDSDEVSGYKDIIPNRSLGGLYGWERVVDAIISPRAFSYNNRADHVLDVLIKPNETLNDYYGSINSYDAKDLR